MEPCYEIKVRAILGPDAYDDKGMVIFGRLVKWTEEGIEYADPKDTRLSLEFGVILVLMRGVRYQG
eukprot:2342880-Karenia_brevis.AAC.1